MGSKTSNDNTDGSVQFRIADVAQHALCNVVSHSIDSNAHDRT